MFKNKLLKNMYLTRIIKLDRKYVPILIYFLYLFCSLYVLYEARKSSIMGMPPEGTDQLSMLKVAAGIYNGNLPPEGYKYSPTYTLFLYCLVFLSHGNLVIMRILQAALCSFVPVAIYKLCIQIRIGKDAALLSTLLYLFYGPSLLISLEFLRAAPLSLCFILFVYFIIKMFLEKSSISGFIAGMLGGLCILGRENFIPIIFLTCFGLIVLKLINKWRITKLKVIAYSIGVLFVLTPVCSYNLCRYGTLAIIPGNFENVVGFYHGSMGNGIDMKQYLSKIAINIPSQVYKSLSSYEIPNGFSFYAHREIIDFLKIFIIPYNLLVIFAIAGCVLKRKNYAVLLIGLFCVFYFLTMLYFEMFFRFRIPVVPLLAVLGGAGLYSLIRTTNVKKKIIIIGVIIVCFLFTYKDPDKMRTVSERLTVLDTLILNRDYYKAEKMIKDLEKYSIDVEAQKNALIEAELRGFQ